MVTNVMAGNPSRLQERAQGYLSSSDAIRQAADELSRLAFDHRSKAVDEVSTRANDVAKGLNVAHTRYRGTASALKVYGVELSALQKRYTAASGNVDQLEATAANAQAQQDRLTNTIKVHERNDSPDNVIAQYKEELWRWQNRDRNAEAALKEARGAVSGIERDFEDAAKKAIASIDTAIKESNDGFWDKLAKFVEDVHKTFVDLAKWAKEQLKAALDALDRLLDAIGPFITLALLLAAVWLVGGLLGLIPGIGPLLGALVITLGTAAIIGAGLLAVERALTDVTAPDPTVVSFSPKDTKTSPSTLSNVFNEAGEVDQMGGKEASVVKIEKIIDENGGVSWRVVMPSTQDWQALAPFMTEEEIGVFEAMIRDSGATNDVDSNLALLMFPRLRTQYERAVLDAMSQAGIKGGPNGDPVMLVGFSQGGIMAGHLAANRSSEYNFDAIVVSGAPIDHMNIPTKTTVISFQHQGDPVPKLDRLVRLDQSAPRQEDHWRTYYVPPPAGAVGVGQIHNSANYSMTLNTYLGDVWAFDPSLQRYFPGEGDVAEAYHYQWQE